MDRQLKKPLDYDTQLMVQVAEGDRDAFAELFRKYRPVVSSYLAGRDSRQESPEGLTQEVFTRIWQNKDRFRRDSSFRTYVLGSAKKVLQERQRRRLREVALQQDWATEGLADDSPDFSQPESEAHRSEVAEAVRAAMLRLPPKQLQAVELFYVMGLSIRQAATLANCSPGALEKRLCRARKQMRRMLGPLQKPPSGLPGT